MRGFQRTNDATQSKGFATYFMFAKNWSGQGESNPRHSAWEADVLPLNYARAGTLL